MSPIVSFRLCMMCFAVKLLCQKFNLNVMFFVCVCVCEVLYGAQKLKLLYDEKFAPVPLSFILSKSCLLFEMNLVHLKFF